MSTGFTFPKNEAEPPEMRSQAEPGNEKQEKMSDVGFHQIPARRPALPSTWPLGRLKPFLVERFLNTLTPTLSQRAREQADLAL